MGDKEIGSSLFLFLKLRTELYFHNTFRLCSRLIVTMEHIFLFENVCPSLFDVYSGSAVSVSTLNWLFRW